MFANTGPDRLRRAGALMCAGLVLGAFAPARGEGPHKRRAASLTSTQRAEYRILGNNEEKGRETIEKQVFSNNTIALNIDASLTYGPGVVMKQRVELLVEEESFFPRTLHVRKTVAQPDGTSFEHVIDLEMISNVAVVNSEINNQQGSRRAVVPTGVGVCDVGVLGYFYQALFWYDRGTGGGQRYEWLDPISVTVNGGELKLEKEETITVLGKKKKVSVYAVEREKLGAATLWVDEQGTIVRAEQNFFVYELVSRTNS